jgi:two-component system chemotaxis response regulator CheY
MSRRVLSVGQCALDHGNISRTLQQTFAAQVVPASSAEEGLSLLRQGGFDLVLVNRVFDADGDSGLDLIRAIKGDEQLRPVPVMLVSNFADAQQQAIANGAEPGFGKGALTAPETAARLKPYLSKGEKS